MVAGVGTPQAGDVIITSDGPDGIPGTEDDAVEILNGSIFRN